EAVQRLDRHVLDIAVILDDEDRLEAALSLGVLGIRFGFPLRGSCGLREVQRDGRPSARLAVDRDMAAGLLREAVDLAQSETAALADLLRREEGLKDPFEDRGLDPGSRVG